jgi:hypothetical protein
VTAYVTKGEIRRSWRRSVETSRSASRSSSRRAPRIWYRPTPATSEPANLIAVFVADEGAQLTTFIE